MYFFKFFMRTLLQALHEQFDFNLLVIIQFKVLYKEVPAKGQKPIFHNVFDRKGFPFM